MAARIVANGGRGSGVDPDGTWFPFVDPSDDVQGLLEDFWFVFPLSDELPAVVLPLQVVSLTGLGKYFDEDEMASSASSAGNEADVVIADAEGTVLFDSSEATYYTTRTWGPRLRIHEWRLDARVCRLVQHTAFDSLLDVVDWPDELLPESANLDARCYQILPGRVEALRVGDDLLRGNIRLVAGYNVVLTPGTHSQDGLLAVDELELAAVPGTGEGRSPGCTDLDTDAPILRRINGVAADAQGNLRLQIGDCLYARPELTLVGSVLRQSAATLKIGNDCGPCCDCQDYVNVYKALRRLHSQFLALGQRAEAARDIYATDVTRLETQRTCSLSDIIHVVLRAQGDYVDIAASICNTSEERWPNVEMQIALTINNQDSSQSSCDAHSSDACCGVASSGPDGRMRAAPLALNDDGQYVFFWDSIAPWKHAVARLRVLFDCIDEDTSVTVTITATSEIDGVIVSLPVLSPQTVAETVAFNDC